MAWNGSDGIAAHDQPRRAAEAKSRCAQKFFLLPLVAVVAIVILCVWLVLRSREKPIESNVVLTDTRTAGTVEIPRQRQKPNSPAREAQANNTEGESLPAAKNTAVLEESTKAASTNVIVNDGSHRPPDRYAVLTLNCDKQIAGLLYAVPGQLMIGTVDFDEDFENQFQESLKTKLEPSQDATEEEREIIEAVNDAKEAVVKAMKAEGKTAGEILSEARQQLREFGQYKQMLEEELRRYESDEEKTDEDVSDLFDAANIILKENGIAPFEPNDLTREVVRQYKFDQQEKNEQ